MYKAKKSRGLLAMALVATVACWSGRARADTVSDLDTVDLGAQVAANLKSDFTTNSGRDIGDLVGSVFKNSAGVYTYVFELTPGINNISEFNAGFDVQGFNGVMGYSFSQASGAGGTFDVEHESDGTIDWNAVGRQNGSKFFDAGEKIKFFFQSTLAPIARDVYNLINHRSGSTENYAPGTSGGPPAVPAPAALPAGLALLGIIAAARRRLIG